MRRSAFVSTTALLSAASIALSLARAEVPFPVLTYLKIDFAELPDFIAFVTMGAGGGFAVATVHFIGLLAATGDVLGAPLKYMAVVSNMAGMGLLWRRSRPMGVAAGAVLRVAVMTVANYLVLAVLFPGWMSFVASVLKDLGVRGEGEALAWALGITAVYNAVHALLSTVPAAAVGRYLEERGLSYGSLGLKPIS